MLTRKTRIKLTVFVLFAVAALIMGTFIGQKMQSQQKKNMAAFHGTWLEQPRRVSAFTLVGVDEKPFSNQDLKQQWTLLFFGFTSCSSICPTTMAELGKMYQLLQEKQVAPMPHVVMVSLDPARDAPNTLGHYVKAFNPHFYGASGRSEAGVKGLAQEMGIAYMKTAVAGSRNTQDYNIEHTGTIMLINPQGELTAFFTSPHSAASLAADYKLATS